MEEAVLEDSILTSIKKLLGLDSAYNSFDNDVVMHINSVFSILNQLGVGPTECFSIKDSSAVWKDFVSDAKNLELVKTYVYMKVRKMFDPPTSSALMDSLNQMISELEWRISVTVDPKS